MFRFFSCNAIVQIQQLKILRSASQEMAESFWILYYIMFSSKNMCFYLVCLLDLCKENNVIFIICDLKQKLILTRATNKCEQTQFHTWLSWWKLYENTTPHLLAYWNFVAWRVCTEGILSNQLVSYVKSLDSNQEEADTRTMFHLHILALIVQ